MWCFLPALCALASVLAGCGSGGSDNFSILFGIHTIPNDVGQVQSFASDGLYAYMIGNSTVSKIDPSQGQTVGTVQTALTDPRRLVDDGNSLYVAFQNAGNPSLAKFSAALAQTAGPVTIPNTKVILGMATRSGSVYVLHQAADNTFQVSVFDTQLNLQTAQGFTIPSGVVSNPVNIAVDNAPRVLVADNSSTPAIVRLTSTGARDTSFNVTGLPNGRLGAAKDVAIASAGRVLVADSTTIQTLDSNGAYVVVDVFVNGNTSLTAPDLLTIDPIGRIDVIQNATKTLYISQSAF
jgi:hypothetical protein